MDIAAAAALVAVVGMLLGTVPEEALAVVEVGAGIDTLAAGTAVVSRSGSVTELLRCIFMRRVAFRAGRGERILDKL